MKRKLTVLLTGVMAVSAICGGSAGAMTYGYDTGRGTIYVTEIPGDVQNRTVVKEDTTGEYSLAENFMSEDEKKYYREEMRESIAYLEKYGVSYDAEKDQILYQGKTVRYLIDEQGDGAKVIQMPEGEIDIYTERTDFTLTGVKIASREEYDSRTREIGAVQAAGDTIAERIECTYEALEADGYTESDIEIEYKERTQEYAQHGIKQSRNGGWMWNEKPVYLLMDEDGGFYQNGGAKADKIYLVVKRNEDGSIHSVKQVTVEEAMAERIAWDN